MSDVWLDAALVNAELQLGCFTSLDRDGRLPEGVG